MQLLLLTTLSVCWKRERWTVPDYIAHAKEVISNELLLLICHGGGGIVN